MIRRLQILLHYQKHWEENITLQKDGTQISGVIIFEHELSILHELDMKQNEDINKEEYLLPSINLSLRSNSNSQVHGDFLQNECEKDPPLIITQFETIILASALIPFKMYQNQDEIYCHYKNEHFKFQDWIVECQHSEKCSFAKDFQYLNIPIHDTHKWMLAGGPQYSSPPNQARIIQIMNTPNTANQTQIGRRMTQGSIPKQSNMYRRATETPNQTAKAIKHSC